MALSKINLGRIAEDGAVTTAKITDGTLVNADFNACAAITSTKADIAQSTELTNAIFKVAEARFTLPTAIYCLPESYICAIFLFYLMLFQ